MTIIGQHLQFANLKCLKSKTKSHEHDLRVQMNISNSEPQMVKLSRGSGRPGQGILSFEYLQCLTRKTGPLTYVQGEYTSIYKS